MGRDQIKGPLEARENTAQLRQMVGKASQQNPKLDLLAPVNDSKLLLRRVVAISILC
jgi:hypothetical protein